jgi:hypothetical protein
VRTPAEVTSRSADVIGSVLNVEDDRASVVERRARDPVRGERHPQARPQAAVFDPESGKVGEERFSADRESVRGWAEQWRGQLKAVAIEATTGCHDAASVSDRRLDHPGRAGLSSVPVSQ